jgi:metal-sulfur cluster biosynthetic enzyme
MNQFYPKWLATAILACCGLFSFSQVSLTATTGTTTATYTTLKAAFDAINAGTHKGTISISITASTTETGAAVLNSSGTGSSSYTSVLVKPATGVDATITGSSAGAVLVLNGADNVTIDGSNSSGGTTRNLSFITPSTLEIPVIWIASASASNGATANVIKNCIVKGSASKVTFGGIISGSGTTMGNLAEAPNNNNTIQNNAISKVQYGVYLGGATTPADSNWLVTQNDIGSSVASDKISANGIIAGYLRNFTISKNNIAGVVSDTSTTASGIYLVGDLTTGQVYYNKIRDIKNTSTDGYGANGIQLTSSLNNSNITIHNNFISDVAGYGYLGDSEEDNGYGIVVTYGGGYNIYYNTVVMNTSENVSGYPAAFNVTSGVTAAGAINLQNNILVNTQTQAGDRYAINSEAPSSVFGTINFNDYYTTGTNVAYINGVDRTNLAGIQAGFGGNLNSVSVLPVFVSATDLHLVAGSNAGVDNKGTQITGITTDIDGETRSVTPDLGADEMPAGADTNGPGITYTLLGFSCTTADRTLTATIVDATGVPVTGSLVPRIYYKKSTGSTWYSSAGTLTSGTGTNGTWTFTIVSADMGGVAVNDVIQYYVIAQDLVGTPNISTFPAGGVASNVNTVTTPPVASSYSINGSLSGTFTVGTGGTYTTLTSAINAYNNSCLAGPVVFSLTASGYGAGETFPMVIGNSLASATNTLTIKPAVGVSASINADSAAFIFNGASYVTIDGSNAVGGTTKNLTINKTFTTGPTIVLQNGSSNNVIKNSIVKGVAAGSGVIVMGGSTAATGNNNNLVQNNDITKGATSPIAGIFNTGTSGKPNTGNTYRGNRIIDFGFYGFIDGNGTLGFSDNTLFEGNELFRTTALPGSVTGIMINNVTGITNMYISKNNIHDLLTSDTTGTVNGIDLYDAASASVTNNMVSIVNNGMSVRGIAQETGTGAVIKILYNTVSISGAVSVNRGSYAYLKDYTSTNDDVRNNIFSNTRVSTGTGVQYAIINSSTGGTMVSNYNDLVSSGNALNVLGRKGTTDYNSLATWQAATAGDANSISAVPVFVSASDLHLSASGNVAIDGRGTPIAAITTDIDGDTRNASTPDIGADEFTGTSCTPPAITTQPTSSTICALNTAQFSVTATGNALTYQWRKAGANIAGATTASYQIVNASTGNSGNYDVVVGSSCGSVTSNTVTLTVNACTAVPSINADVTSAVLMPSVAHSVTKLRIVVKRAMKTDWIVTDAAGMIVMKFTRQLNAGSNDIELQLGKLSGGTYQVTGQANTGKLTTLRFIKQ